jgi:predicted alpha/beta-hydrolase family hydrolase
MTQADASITFSIDGDPSVRGALHRAEGTRTMVLAHGAGSTHQAPLLVTVARAFADAGVTVLRCELPFRQARASGPPRPAEAERDRRGLAAALDAVASGAGPHLIGGHSYGGRQASMLLAEQPARAHGLLLLSYPLHPPSKPERRRIEHLPALRVPTLFVHGTRDPFGTPEEIEAVRALVDAPTALLLVKGAAHGLRSDATLSREIVSALFELVRGR